MHPRIQNNRKTNGPIKNKYLNKKTFNKSLFSFYLLFNRVPREHDIMSSCLNLEEAIATERNQYNEYKQTITQRNSATFEYVSNLTGLRIQHQIEILESIHEQDILKWSLQFKEIADMCKWSEEGRLEVLSHIINPEIRSKIVYTGTTDRILETILILKYNPSQAHHYYQKLANIKQGIFFTLRAYSKAIIETCKKLALCSNWSDELLKQKTEETFFMNLENHVKIEMQKVGKNTLEEVHETIDKIESMIIEEIAAHNTETKTNNKNSESFHQIRKDKNSVKGMRKFCDYHQSTSHSNEECRYQKKRNTEKKSENKTKGYVICEPRIKARAIEMKMKIKDASLDCLIDTGASYNFIPVYLAEELNLETRQIEEEIQVETASGESIMSSSIVRLEFYLNEDKNCRYKTDFYLFNSRSRNIILGMQFLKDNDAIINLKDNYIKIDNREYEIYYEETKLDEHEQTIAAKSAVFSMSHSDVDFKELVKKLKKKNPRIGNLKFCEHEIDLEPEFVPKFKE
ncbi:hypothetical protein DMUE_4317 [Dictyocoela muelleri]|nr:hypothetical protein DMUE_4317 [Dictyocoela muelleri]